MFDNKMFAHKKILLIGMGREGQSTLKFINKFFPSAIVATTDKKDGDNYLNNLDGYDLVIKSPGISWNIKEIKKAKEKGVKFSSQTQIFLELFKDKTIGVTGTKGKSTTASLIYNILKTAGKNVKLVGNIGNPVLDSVDDFNDKSLFVYEMSSHQLSDVTMSPHVAVLLNIYPEHLDYYSSFEEYFDAKKNIAKYQNENDYLIYNSDFDEIKKFANSTKSQKLSFSQNDQLAIIKSPLIGVHNKNNILAAIDVAQVLKIDKKYIEEGIESFKPLEHRLEIVRNINGVSFINDGLATIPQATISAVQSFEKGDITLILGGFDRGIDFEVLGKFLSTAKNVKNIILIGDTANKINKVLEANKFNGNIYNLGKTSMEEIVKKAYEVTKPAGVVLLSPAATSFDMFKDYKDRDDQFKKEVNKLK